MSNNEVKQEIKNMPCGIDYEQNKNTQILNSLAVKPARAVLKYG